MPRQDGAVPLWFYAGAALGPFAGGVIGVVIPALRGEFAADLGALSWAVPAYMIPFAGFQLVSGAISDATSRRLALGIGFLGFALTSALCGLAPSISWFLAGRFGQGSANAFTTAVLTAALADLVPRERLGRATGGCCGSAAWPCWRTSRSAARATSGRPTCTTAGASPWPRPARSPPPSAW